MKQQLIDNYTHESIFVSLSTVCPLCLSRGVNSFSGLILATALKGNTPFEAVGF